MQFRDPHALNTETRGWLKPGRCTDIQWENYIYEYSETRPNGSTLHPHLIILGVQSCNGIDNTICLGELNTIVTAMRCRAFQSAFFNEEAILVGDEQQSINGNPSPHSEDELAFKDEKRFPVCYPFFKANTYLYMYILTSRHTGLGHHGFSRRSPACQDYLRMHERLGALHQSIGMPQDYPGDRDNGA